MTDQELFEKMCREDECWHEFENFKERDSPEWSECFSDTPVLHVCRKCAYEYDDLEEEGKDIDFSTWEGFGWLWERFAEQDWKVGFLEEKTYILDDLNRPEAITGFMSKFGLIDTINPINFFTALKEYLKEQEK